MHSVARVGRLLRVPLMITVISRGVDNVGRSARSSVARLISSEREGGKIGIPRSLKVGELTLSAGGHVLEGERFGLWCLLWCLGRSYPGAFGIAWSHTSPCDVCWVCTSMIIIVITIICTKAPATLVCLVHECVPLDPGPCA